MNFQELCKSLEAKIQQSYEQGVTLEEAEKLAGEFLYAQIQVSAELKKADLDSKMRKAGVKSIRAAIYLDIVGKQDKRPTEAHIAAMLDSDRVVETEQMNCNKAEVEKDELERYYNIFQNAHIHFRGISKGRFE